MSERIRSMTFLVAPSLVAALAAMFVLTQYIDQFGTTRSNSHETWGQFGDFIGGVLNPLLAFLSFVLLLLTIRLQRKSLETSNEELRLSRTELVESREVFNKQLEQMKLQTEGARVQAQLSEEVALYQVLKNMYDVRLSIPTTRGMRVKKLEVLDAFMQTRIHRSTLPEQTKCELKETYCGHFGTGTGDRV